VLDVSRRRSDIDLLVALSALGLVLMVSVSPARSYTATLTPSPWAICEAASLSNQEGLEARLGPSEGSSVQAGTPVTFLGYSEVPVTFAVASSPVLLSSSDIDSGAGSSQPEQLYTFTSTEATASPGTVYWDASFSNVGLAGCAGQPPLTYTTMPRTLTVLPAASGPTMTSVPMTSVPTTTATKPAAATGKILLAGSMIFVHKNSAARVKLTCTGTGACEGKVTLRVDSALKKGEQETVGGASFSIPAGKTSVIELKLNTVGRALLQTIHKQLDATLTILNSLEPASQAQTDNVHLVRQTTTSAKRSTR
jgi:hypothetical protein